LLAKLAGARGHFVFEGTPEQVADLMESGSPSSGRRASNLMPPVLPENARRVHCRVVPILQKRGLFRTEYEGETLRSHLGLARPGGANGYLIDASFEKDSPMRLQRRRFLHLVTAAFALAGAATHRKCAKLSNRPVRVVVPYAPGGPTDVVTRLLAQKISDRTGKQFFVENVGGAAAYRHGPRRQDGAGRIHAADGQSQLRGQSDVVARRALPVREGLRPGLARGSHHAGDLRCTLPCRRGH